MDSFSDTYFKTTGTSVASWDCISPGNCQDPGTGNGQYNTLNSCLASCSATEVDENGVELIAIYPNPIKNSLFINGNFDYLEIFDVFGKLILSSDQSSFWTTNQIRDHMVILHKNQV